MEQKKVISLGYGPFVIIIFVTLIIGLVSGSILGGLLVYVATGHSIPRLIQPVMSERPWLGITYVPITARSARLYDLAADKGALIVAVTPNSPAAKAGLREGDIILALDQRTLDETTSLMDMIVTKKPGDRVQVTILRGGSQRTVEVILGRLPVSTRPSEGRNWLERLWRTITNLWSLR